MLSYLYPAIFFCQFSLQFFCHLIFIYNFILLIEFLFHQQPAKPRPPQIDFFFSPDIFFFFARPLLFENAFSFIFYVLVLFGFCVPSIMLLFQPKKTLPTIFFLFVFYCNSDQFPSFLLLPVKAFEFRLFEEIL